MKALLNEEREYLIELLKKEEKIPEDYKYKLFPTIQKEYELVYAGKMRKEDILSNEDGVYPVPLQIDKVFNAGKNEEVSNMIVFGDNLQFLKTVYEDKDPLIKEKIKGKVKFIYIDPPFATESDFSTETGEKAYSDKVNGAEFIEFLRRRLVVAKEILSEDGVIYVHLDWKKVHHIKLVMDEVFGEEKFRNEIIWKYFGPTSTEKNYPRKHEVILFYSNSNEYYFNNKAILVQYDEKAIKRYDKIDSNGNRYKIYRDQDGSERISYMKPGKPTEIFEIPFVQGTSKEKTGYPTQKPELLLKRLIEASTKEGDLVMDFFAGSGTTAAVAEKLNRKWIVCDVGRLSLYTIQKRLLTIEDSKSLDNSKKSYGKKSNAFITVSTGMYDLAKIFDLKKNQYTDFVMNLFYIEKIEKKINGIKIDGEKSDGNYVIIYQYWEFKDSVIDEEYIECLHSLIGDKIGKRLYIVAPANYISFITDYYEIDNIRYYFLKVPYQIINELHKVKFKKLRQPQSKKNINSLEDTVGFHFIRPPKVDSMFEENNEYIFINIKSFYSSYTDEETGKDMKNFEAISMILIDTDYNEKNFIMKKYYFARDLIDGKLKDERKLKDELKNKDTIKISLLKRICGKKIMIIYVDIYGNEFKEVFNIKESEI